MNLQRIIITGVANAIAWAAIGAGLAYLMGYPALLITVPGAIFSGAFIADRAA